jgi:hypothetical protein
MRRAGGARSHRRHNPKGLHLFASPHFHDKHSHGTTPGPQHDANPTLPHPFDWLPILLAIAVAYIVFGIAGFGTALVAGPVLIHFMPLSRIIPLLVLLDFVAAFGNLLPSRRDVVRGELLRLLPCMAVGCTLGVVFLLHLKSDLLLLLMGCSSPPTPSTAWQ